MFHCVLFDLDGTLLDTAPDLTAALNRALTNEGFAPVAVQTIRPLISCGAAAMVDYALGPRRAADLRGRVLNRMLEEYLTHIADQTDLFEGMADVLAELHRRNLKWGVVTNKRARFTEPLLDTLGLAKQAACIVSGDSTPNCKPHPEPVLAACKITASKPSRCVYVGDSVKDVQAGRRAGMRTLGALYGYLGAGDDATRWGADALLGAPGELLNWLDAHDCS